MGCDCMGKQEALYSTKCVVGAADEEVVQKKWGL